MNNTTKNEKPAERVYVYAAGPVVRVVVPGGTSDAAVKRAVARELGLVARECSVQYREPVSCAAGVSL